jgi:hypothetical protein
MFTGKRTDRLELPRQLRADAELARLIRMRAGVNRRTIQQELLHLIDVGLKAESVSFRQTPSVEK